MAAPAIELSSDELRLEIERLRAKLKGVQDQLKKEQSKNRRLMAVAQDNAKTSSSHAAAIADQAKAIAGLAPEPFDSTVTIRQIFDAYQAVRINDHSWKNIRNRILPVVRIFGELPAFQLTPKKWGEYKRIRITEPTNRGPRPSGTTINLELARTKTMLSWAAQEEQGFIRVNPLRDARRDKPKPPRRTWLSEADLQTLLASKYPATEPARTMFRAFAITNADTGLRYDELRKLRRDRIRIISDDEIIAEIPDTKNRKPHLVGITRRGFDSLEAIPNSGSSPFYFANPHSGRVVAVTSPWRWTRSAAEDSGIDALVADGEIQFRPHDFRRSAATNAHNRGASLVEVQDMLNHSNPSITAQYIQRTPMNAVKIARLMEAGAESELAGSRRGPQRVNMDPEKRS